MGDTRGGQDCLAEKGRKQLQAEAQREQAAEQAGWVQGCRGGQQGAWGQSGGCVSGTMAVVWEWDHHPPTQQLILSDHAVGGLVLGLVLSL